MTTRNLSSTEAKLITLGLSQILTNLLTCPLPGPVELSFSSLKTAKMVQTLLYQWLWFYPQIKEGISLSLNNETATLTLVPRGLPERRGRRGGKI